MKGTLSSRSSHFMSMGSGSKGSGRALKRQPLPPVFLALLPLLLSVLPSGHTKKNPQNPSSRCTHLLSLLLPSPPTILPSVLEDGTYRVSLSFSPRVEVPAGMALTLLRNGAMVAYGFDPREDLVLPPRDQAQDLVLLAASHDTGGNTLKDFSSLCPVHEIVAPSSHPRARPPDTGTPWPFPTIISPRPGSRLLASEMHTLKFSLSMPMWLSITCNGTEVRERGEHETGEHEIDMDFLPPEGAVALSVNVWEFPHTKTGMGQWVVRNSVDLYFSVVHEPPSILIEWPPPDYVFRDVQVKIIVSVSYFAFLRYPALEHSGTIVLDIDGQEAPTQASILRDAEGVHRLQADVGPPYTNDGYHIVTVRIFALGNPIPSCVQTVYKVESSQQQRTPRGVFDVREWVPDGDRAVGKEPFCANDDDCSGPERGVCYEGVVCRCSGDFVGDRCEIDLMTDSDYFPPYQPHLHPQRVLLQAFFDQGSRELLHSLESLHKHTQACAPDKAIKFQYNDQGLAAQVSDASVELSHAFTAGLTAVHTGEWTYGLHDGCQHKKGFACHFHPFVECKDEQVAALPQLDGNTVIDPKRAVPDEYRHKGLFWWYSHVQSFMLQPSLDFQLKLRSVMGAMGLDHPIIGVHVRNGDYCSHENDHGGHCLLYKHCVCQGFDEYLVRIRQMRDMYGVRNVFLATQDQKIVRAAQSEEGLRVYSLSFDRQVLTGSAARTALHWRQKQGYVDSVMVSEAALLDLFVLAECDFFIGSFHSQYSRLALSLMAAKKGVVPPFSSVHLAWGDTLAYPL